MQKLQPCLLFADGLNCSWQTFRKAAALLAGWIAGSEGLALLAFNRSNATDLSLLSGSLG
jgi:hypothetical protein